MAIRYLSKPYTQANGATATECEVDLHSEIPTNVAPGSRCFCREHGVEHIRNAQGTWLDGAGSTAAPAPHNHDSTYAAAVHGHAFTQPFPVGSVFISVVTTNPATLLGYGTWVAFGAGRVLIGNDGATFGTDEVTGGVSSQSISAHSGTAVGNHANHVVTQPGGHTTAATATTGSGLRFSAAASATHAGTAVDAHSAHSVTQPGNHTDINNMQPYIVVHMWKRTA